MDALAARGIVVWIDGGWGVDALVGEQTRDHTDLDLAVDRSDLEGIANVLRGGGFNHHATIEPGLPARLVLRNPDGREIDVHPLVFDVDGNGWQQLSESGRAWGKYPAEHLEARGLIADTQVRCLSPELHARFRLGYEWSDRDEHDLCLLAGRFGIAAIPPRSGDDAAATDTVESGSARDSSRSTSREAEGPAL